MKTYAGWAAQAAVLAAVVAPAFMSAAQAAEVKEKPALYTYEATWVLPRASWPEMEKSAAANQKVMEEGMAGGTIVGYGSDQTRIHTAEGSTHDTWFQSMSMAGLMGTLDALYRSGSADQKVLATATKHWDDMYESHYYNWKAGTYKGAYTHTGIYRLKPDSPDEAVDLIAKSMLVPVFEKLLAEGTLVEYEIDEQAIHTDSPGMFAVVYITKDAAGLDKAMAALQDSFKANAVAGPAFASMVDMSAHRDYLGKSDLTYK
jgi:basic membrane lipoprotein Med (substrate-binding protein (PBP1-ABC) superfamily)